MKETTASTLALEKGSKMQQTVAKAFTQSGVGLHTGLEVQVRVLPAAAGTGRYFVRVDMHSQPIIPARVEAVSQTVRLSWVGRTVCTVEHLLAALAMMGVDARIEIDGLKCRFWMDRRSSGWKRSPLLG